MVNFNSFCNLTPHAVAISFQQSTAVKLICWLLVLKETSHVTKYV